MLLWWIAIAAVHYWMAPPTGDRGWIALQPLVWIPAIRIFSLLSSRRAFLVGWLLGTMANVAIYSWLIETMLRFTDLDSVGAVAVLLIYSVVAGLVIGVFAWGVAPLRRVSGRAWPFAVAAWLVTSEQWVPQFFPYFQGVGWVSFPSIYLVTAHTGVAGMSFLVFLASGLGLAAYETAFGLSAPGVPVSRSTAAAGVVAFALAFSAAGYQEARIAAAERKAKPLRIALIQDNLEREERLRRFRNDVRGATNRLVAISESALADDPTLEVVMWSEGALSSMPKHGSGASVRNLTRRHDLEVWTGAMTQSRTAGGKWIFNNSVYRIADGVVSAPYHKNVLVPISEALPFADWFPSLPGLVGAIEGTGMLSPGEGVGIYTVQDFKVAYVICYEAILRAPMRDSVNAGASLLANFTYEAWFGDTRELDQHLAMARAQVAQLGVPMARVATTGISAFIDARGRVQSRGGRFNQEVLVGDVLPLRVPGLYARIGPWFAWLCTVFCAALLFRARAR